MRICSVTLHGSMQERFQRFSNYNAHEMLNTVRYAERIYYDKKRDWNKMIERAMTQDFSWMNSARQYEDLYRSLIGE